METRDFTHTELYKEGTTVYDALEKGLEDLMGLCNVVIDKFVDARDRFRIQPKILSDTYHTWDNMETS